MEASSEESNPSHFLDWDRVESGSSLGPGVGDRGTLAPAKDRQTISRAAADQGADHEETETDQGDCSISREQCVNPQKGEDHESVVQDFDPGIRGRCLNHKV